jgi:phosphatidylglycerophosphatase A
MTPHPFSSGKKSSFVPTVGWVFASLPRVIAFGGGSGLLRPGPGTWGTLLGWLIWVLALTRLPDTCVVLVLLGGFLLGCWACGRAGRELGAPDHGGMVIDEIVAIWLVLWLTPQTLLMQVLAFGLFRFFDILKPPPVRYFDQHVKGGFGVMIDDLVAAGYSLLVLAVIVRVTGLG